MEKNTPIIVSVTGWSGSGKTTFCERLIAELSARGQRVSAAKNSHQDLFIDREGSDSLRFYNSGADAVCLNANNSMTIFRHNPLKDAEELIRLFSDSEFIIAEGFKALNSIRIEVTGTASLPEEMKNPASGADIIVYGKTGLKDELLKDNDPATGIRLIHRDDIIAAADFLTELLT
ncbi:MAG: molybdopterin-guanine dinucleotide biosynthesis protein B [Spirochaetales bacterium]|nr:molybdopterin-guanine dinucleotide biosynthesis protein B [Spirochaetales bacterium]